MAGQAGLAAVGSCVATTFAAEAALRGIDLNDLEMTVEGRVDLRGAFELADVSVGLAGVTVTIEANLDVDGATLEKLAEVSRRSSPMYQTFANPVRMHLQLAS